MDDLIAHPQRRTITVETPSGPIEMMSPGAHVPGTAESFGPVPAIGEHTAALRAEFASD
jgi:hypothetical protein